MPQVRAEEKKGWLNNFSGSFKVGYIFLSYKDWIAYFLIAYYYFYSAQGW